MPVGGSRGGLGVRRDARGGASAWLPLALGVAAVLALGVAIWIAGSGTGSSNRSSEPANTVARVRALSPVSGCLLTDSRGVGRAPASEVWAGLQDAAAATKVRASFLPLTKAGAARDQVNGLIAQGCNLIIGVGIKPVAAISAIASSAPATVHLAVAGVAGSGRVEGFQATRTDTLASARGTFARLGAAS